MSRKIKLPEFLDELESEKLLSIPDLGTQNGLRNFCILLVMLDGGLRCSEVLSLRAKDIEWEQGRVKIVQGKGGRDRIVFFPRSTLIHLQSLIAQNKSQGRINKKGFLFLTCGGRKVDARYIRRMIKKYAQRAGITKDVHPHTLRHTFASKLYKNTNDIRLVQKALGHASITTTQVYVHLHDGKLESEMKSLWGRDDKPVVRLSRTTADKTRSEKVYLQDEEPIKEPQEPLKPFTDQPF